MIKNNVGRKAKALWTQQDAGDKIDCKDFDTAYDEAEYIATASIHLCVKGYFLMETVPYCTGPMHSHVC